MDNNWSAPIQTRLVSSNLLLKLLNVFIKIIELLSGIIRKGTISDNGDTISIKTAEKFCWFFLAEEKEIIISKNKISSIAVGREKTLFIFSTNIIEINAGSEFSYQVKKVSYSEISEKTKSWVTPNKPVEPQSPMGLDSSTI